MHTDNNPLTYMYVLTSAKLNATGMRWVGELADFHFSIYRPGKSNGDADTLSREPLTLPAMTGYSADQEITRLVIQAVHHGVQVNEDVPWNLALPGSEAIPAQVANVHSVNRSVNRTTTSHSEE